LVRLLTPVETDDGEGGQSVTWDEDDGPQLWAEVASVSAREQAIAGAIQTVAPFRVTTYYDTRIDGTKRFARVSPTGPTLQILGVRDVDGRQRLHEIDCAEVI
jgi:SPP1 family predicted phage head-tail adaptor